MSGVIFYSSIQRSRQWVVPWCSQTIRCRSITQSLVNFKTAKQQLDQDSKSKSKPKLVKPEELKKNVGSIKDEALGKGIDDIQVKKQPSSKVEEATKEIKKKKVKYDEKFNRKSLVKKIEEELQHYYHGFRLLILDFGIASGLVLRILKGHSLTRREHSQLVRTTGDLFRLLPFSVFVVVPFMEFTLPFFLKFFPGMLPSTFQSKKDKELKRQAELKVKLDMAKFLQKTLDEMPPEANVRNSEDAKDFADFMRSVRETGAEVSNDAILKYSKLFEDQITLDSLTKDQLKALCRLLGLGVLGSTKFLRFELTMRIRKLKVDDKVIQMEGGVGMLTTEELQQACKDRGMRAFGMPRDRLERQLMQWLELSLEHDVPTSLILLSRTMYIHDSLTTPEQIKKTLETLPQSVDIHAKGVIEELQGVVVAKTRVDIVTDEQRMIEQERKEDEEAVIEKPQQIETVAPMKPTKSIDAPLGTELYPDKISKSSPSKPSKDVQTNEEEKTKITQDDAATIEFAIGKLGKKRGNENLIVEKEELKELKHEMAEYKEDVEQLQEVKTKERVHETTGAKNLHKQLVKLLSEIDTQVNVEAGQNTNIDTKKQFLKTEKEEKPFIRVDELFEAIKSSGKVDMSSEKLTTFQNLLRTLDKDKDGKLEVDDVVKVLDTVLQESFPLEVPQVGEISEVITKEEQVEVKLDSKANEGKNGSENSGSKS